MRLIWRALAAAVVTLMVGGLMAAATPAAAASKVKFVQIATSETHTLALTSTGVVYGWGYNACGSLGTGRAGSPKYRPTRMKMPKSVHFKQVAAGDNFSVGLSTKGVVYTWGCNGRDGSLGTGKKGSSAKPVKPKLPMGVKIKAIAAGPRHVLALATDGVLYAWGNTDRNGDTDRSALGDGTTKIRRTPVKVVFPEHVTITWITAGRENFSAARDSTGAMWAWGLNEQGELAVPTWKDGIDRGHFPQLSKLYTTPVKMQAPEGVSLVEVARNSLEALGSDGNVYTWGFQVSGLFGDGTKKSTADYPIIWRENQCCGWMTFGIYPTPSTERVVARPAGVSFTQVGQHSSPDQTGYTAIGSDGYLYVWGQNYGMLGDGTSQDQVSPVRVKTPGGVKIIQTAADGCSAFALGSNGKIYVWGRGYDGPSTLGVGRADRTYPTPIEVKVP